MKFYSLSVEDSLGVQVLHDGKIGDYLDSKNLYESYNENIPINNLFFNDKIIKTDILDCGELSLKGFVVSDTFVGIVKNLKLHEVQFVDIKSLEGYSFMFFNGDLTFDIDYESSYFKLYELDIIDMEFLPLNIDIKQTRECIIDINRDVVLLDIEKKIFPSNGYVFKKGKSISEFDCFRIGYFDLTYNVSENFKNIVESNGLSGFKFVENSIFDKGPD